MAYPHTQFLIHRVSVYPKSRPNHEDITEALSMLESDTIILAALIHLVTGFSEDKITSHILSGYIFGTDEALSMNIIHDVSFQTIEDFGELFAISPAPTS